MSQSSGGGKDGRKKAPLIQRPLRKFKQDLVSEDEKLARELQEEEEKRSTQFHNDELLAQQLAQEINGEHKNGDHDDLHGDFARYRGMTEVDFMLARQMQRQEEETANAQAIMQEQQLQNFQQLQAEDTPQGSGDNAGFPRRVIGPPQQVQVFLGNRGRHGNRGGVNRVQIGMQEPQRRGQLRRPVYQNRRPAVPLPDGEDDPDMLLMSLGGGMDVDFMNIMQDPLLLVMALSRAPHFTGNQQNVDLDDYDGLWELAERLGEVQKRGMSEGEIGNLPAHSHQVGATSAAQSTDCQVCLTAFEQGERIRTLPCLHEYHSKCIDEWLKRNSSCPICRQDVRAG